MDPRLRRIIIMIPLAVGLVFCNAGAEGWPSIFATLAQFTIGTVVLVLIFKLSGWM